tara:strand:+ start:275 stop:871 length:597 start_codon:yes stop_codon:yes gene_type:complete
MSSSDVSTWIKQLAVIKSSAKKEIRNREYNVNALICIPDDGGDVICLLDPTVKYTVGDTLSKHGENYSVSDVIDAQVVLKQDQALYIRSDQIAKAKSNLVYVAKVVDGNIAVGCLKRGDDGYSVLPQYQEKFGQATFKQSELLTPDTMIVGSTHAALELNEIKRSMELEPTITMDMVKDSQIKPGINQDSQPSLSRRM